MPEIEAKSWIDKFVEYTDNSEPPELYRRWTAISVVAAALQRKVHLTWGTYKLFPNMYIVLVGPPAARKGTAMAPGSRMLRKLGVKLAAEATTREALISTLKESFRTDITPDGNTILSHSSLTIFSPELTVFLGYNNVILMADLSDWYDSAERWTYRTKNAGTDEIDGVFVNLLGATTPQLLQTTLPQDAIGGGLTSRIVFVYEDKKGKVVAAPFLTTKQANLEEWLQEDLDRIYLLNGEYQVTKSYMKRWTEWYEHQDAHPPFNDQKFAGYLGRRQTHVQKLSMILCASYPVPKGQRKLIITEDHLNEAIDLLELTEVKMPNVFGGFGQNALASVMEKILKHIRVAGKRIPVKEISRMFLYDADKNDIALILETLESGDYINIIHGDKGVEVEAK